MTENFFISKLLLNKILKTVMSQSIPTGYIPLGNPQRLAQKNCPGAGNSTRAGILWKFKVKRFAHVLVLLVINTGCPKNC